MIAPLSEVLVVQLRQIGDVVLTTPIPHLLKEALPGCRVTFLTERPSDQLLQHNPYIDEVVINDRNGSVRDSLRLGWSLRRRGFDAVLDFMGNPRSAVLSFLSGARVRISYPAAGRGLLYTHRVPTGFGYAVEIKKRLLGPLGIADAWDRPEVFLTAAEELQGRAHRQRLVLEGRRLVTVDPAHRRSTRRWPAGHYSALCRSLSTQLSAVPLVLWGPGEEELARQVVAGSDGRARLAPPTRLREMAALIKAADLHVGNCSAPRHIAVAVGTPTYTILGSTSPGWTHPAPEHNETALGLDCQPCNRNTCEREMACLTGLDPDRVAEDLSAWTQERLGWSAP
jgi:ADP-heptose:LPS heptosyltransferase